MKYVLITSTGRVQCFYIKSVAELYQNINGGFIVATDEKVLDENTEIQYNYSIDDVKGL